MGSIASFLTFLAFEVGCRGCVVRRIQFYSALSLKGSSINYVRPKGGGGRSEKISPNITMVEGGGVYRGYKVFLFSNKFDFRSCCFFST